MVEGFGCTGTGIRFVKQKRLLLLGLHNIHGSIISGIGTLTQMPPTRPLKVFLCHASADKPAVRKLYRYLRSKGMEPWLDAENLLPGENWEVEIPRAIFNSDVILVCLSKNSVNKEGYVQKEIIFALDKAKEKLDESIFIIPAKLEECDVPLRLNRYQWVDLYHEDGRKRLMLSLNKRAAQLGPAIEQAVIIDETEREKIANEAVQKVDKEIIEKALREPPIEFASHKKEQEANAEKIAREKEEKENKEKLSREKLEHDAAEKANHEAKAEPIVERPVIAQFKPKKQFGMKLPLWGIGLIAFGILIMIVWGISSIPTISEPTKTPSATQTQLLKPATETLLATQTLFVETETSTPSATQTLIIEPPTKTPLPAISTETTIPTSILNIGSTMIGEDGATLIFVPEGEFLMGSKDTDSPSYTDERPQHPVTLNAFWIDKTEVTNKLYAACVSGGGCTPPSATRSSKRFSYYDTVQFEEFPVILVDWNQANAYCSWAGRKLPTEAQWEKAARGTDARIYPWGFDVPNKELLNYYSYIGDTTKVGSYKTRKSFYGAYDMAGNVKEWVNDWYSENYYENSPSFNPLGPDFGDFRVLRGGSWYDSNLDVLSANRTWNVPVYSDVFVGFRCSLSP